MKYLVQDTIPTIFGQVTPVGPMTGDPMAELGKLMAFGVRMFIIVAGIFLMVYLFWGALDWLSSGGDKERLAKAQQKLFNAVLGMIIIFVVIGIWGFITGDILGIIVNGPDGWKINLPSF